MESRYEEHHHHHHHPQMNEILTSSTESSPIDGFHADESKPLPRPPPAPASLQLPDEGGKRSPSRTSVPRPDDPVSISLAEKSLTFPRRRHKHLHTSPSSQQLVTLKERLQTSDARVAELEAQSERLFQIAKDGHQKVMDAQMLLEKVAIEKEEWKFQYESAQAEIDRANEVIKVSERRRVEAEEREVREREKRRKLEEERMIEQAKQEGYKEGYEQGRHYGNWLAKERLEMQQRLSRMKLPRTFVDPNRTKARVQEWRNASAPASSILKGRQRTPEPLHHHRHEKEHRYQDERRPKSANATARLGSPPGHQPNKEQRYQPENRPKSAAASTRLPTRPESRREQAPDVAKYTEVLPIPTVTTPLPLRIPSTQPQQQPRPPSSVSNALPKQQQPHYHNHHSSLSHPVPPEPVPVDPPHVAPTIRSAPVPSASVPIAAPSPVLPMAVPQVAPSVDTQTQSEYVQPYMLHQVHHLDDHGPHGEPPEEIHPILVHNHPSNPSLYDLSVVVPPDGYIPTDAADGFIHLPPPHEFSRAVSAESEPLKSRASSVFEGDAQSMRSQSRPNSTHESTAPRPVMMDPHYDPNLSRSHLFNNEHIIDRSHNASRAVSDVSRPSTRISQFDLVSPPRGRIIRDSAFAQPQWRIYSTQATPRTSQRNLRSTEEMVEEWRRENAGMLPAISTPRRSRSFIIANPDVEESVDGDQDEHGQAVKQDVKYAGTYTPSQRSRTPLHVPGGPRTPRSVAAPIQATYSYNRADAGGTPYVQSSPLQQDLRVSAYQKPTAAPAPQPPADPPRAQPWTRPPIVQLRESTEITPRTNKTFEWIKARLKRAKSTPGGVNISIEPPSGSSGSTSTFSNDNSGGDPVLLTPDHAGVPNNLPGGMKPGGEGVDPEQSWGLPPGFSTDELGHIKPIVMTLPDDRFPPGFIPHSTYISHPPAVAEPSFGAFHTTTNNALGLMAGHNPKQHYDHADIYAFPPGPGSTHHHDGEHFFSPMSSGYHQ